MVRELPVGHEATRRRLERWLPPVTLLLAPRGVEAWSLGDYLLRFHGVNYMDLLKITKVTAESAQRIGATHRVYPVNGIHRGVLLNLDRPSHVEEQVHDRNLNRLLSVLEDPGALFVLIASEWTLPAIQSRAATYRLGLLTDSEVEEALRRTGQQIGHDELMKQGGTTYGRKVREAEVFLKSNVDAVLKSLEDRDQILFNLSMAGWRSEEDGKVALTMVKGWIREALIGKWVSYKPDPAPQLAKNRAKLKAMLVDLDHYRGNPKIVAQAALDKHLR